MPSKGIRDLTFDFGWINMRTKQACWILFYLTPYIILFSKRHWASLILSSYSYRKTILVRLCSCWGYFRHFVPKPIIILVFLFRSKKMWYLLQSHQVLSNLSQRRETVFSSPLHRLSPTVVYKILIALKLIQHLASSGEFFLEDRKLHHLLTVQWLLCAHIDSSGPDSRKF